MEDNLLQKLSLDVLVIPLSDDAVKDLEQFCTEELEAVTPKRISQLILCSILKSHDVSLHQQLEKYVQDKESLLGLPLNVIEPIISEYVVLKAIDEEEDSQKSALYALMLRNAILLVVKGKGNIACPEEVAGCFNLYHKLLEAEYTFTTDGACDLINDYFSNHVGKESFSTTAKDKLKELKSVFYDAAKHRYDQLLKELSKSDEENNHYVKAYQTAKMLIDDSPWLFIEKQAEKSLWNLVNEKKTETMCQPLSEIMTSIQEKNENIIDEEFDSTSVLLTLISGGEACYKDVNLMNMKFTPMEFAIYIYYEMLTEKLMKHIGKEAEDE